MRKPNFPTLGPIIVAFAIVLAAAGCATPDDNDSRAATQGLPDTQQSLEANIWELDGAASTPPIDTSNPVTIEFDSTSISGRGPCNNYGGQFSLDDHDLTIAKLTQTDMACEGRSENESEQAYFTALQAAKSVDTTDRDRLVIDTADGELIFRVAGKATG